MSQPPQFTDKVKILVVGDSSVGKTSLINLLCYESVLKYPLKTTGCHIEVKLHTYDKRKFFIEFWDVGGSAKYKNVRSTFYNDINGLLMVHDLSNGKSFQNLKMWLREVVKEINCSTLYSWDGNKGEQSFLELEYNDGSGRSLPVLIIGNKSDLISGEKQPVVDEVGTDLMNISSLDKNVFAAGSHGSHKMSSFLDKVIYRSFYNKPEIKEQIKQVTRNTTTPSKKNLFILLQKSSES